MKFIQTVLVSCAITCLPNSGVAQTSQPAGKFNTVADAVLTKDIITNLSSTHKIYHPECKDAQPSSARTLAVTREKATEEWVMAGCGKSFAYTIELIPDNKGGVSIYIPRAALDPSVAKVLSSPPPPTNIKDWAKMGEGREMTSYVNPKSIRRNGHLATIRTMFDYKGIQTEPYGKFMSYESVSEIDCALNKIRLVSAVARGENMGGGTAIWSENVAYPWRDVRVGTTEAVLWEMACQKASPK